MLAYNRRLKEFSRELRKNMTDAERMLWSKVRYKQMKGHLFYRQKPIGNFIVDFYCPKGHLVLEVDGGQHYTEAGQAKDNKRDQYLAEKGLRVLRFSDKDVLENLDDIVEKIYASL